jgi:hypothetical protein
LASSLPTFTRKSTPSRHPTHSIASITPY